MSLPEDSMFPGAGWRSAGAQWKVELDTDETVQPKRLKLVIEVLGMRPEPTIWEVLLEHSELLRDVQGLLKSQLK